MRTSKKIVSLVLAVLMVASMMAVMAVSVSAATTVTTADEFLAIADADGEYVLGADINLGGGYLTIPEGRTVTIDFADYTYTSKYGFENHGTLTVKAGTGGATATGYAVFENFGTLTVESGTYSGNYGVYAKANSTTTINNGTFTAQECCVCTLKNTHDATITIKKGTFTSADNSVLSGNGSTNSGNNTWTISGGTYNANIQSAGYVAAGIYAPNNDTWNVKGGTFNVTNGVGIAQRAGVVNVSGGTFNVTGDGSTGKVGDSRVVLPAGDALVYDEVSSYPGYTAESTMAVTGGTFNAEGDAVYAVAGAAADTHIDIKGGTFTGDVSDYVDEADIAYTYTDAQGKTKYFTSGGPTNFNDGTYTLYKDVTITRAAMALFAYDVTLDLNGHKLTSTNTNKNYGCILMSRSASAASPRSLTVKNGTIDAKCGICVLESYNNLTLDNVTLSVGDDVAIQTNGTKTNNNITVKDSTITSENMGIYKPSTGALVIDNSSITGETGVYVKSGTVEITNSTIRGTGAAADYSYNGNGANSTGDALVIDNCGYPGGAPTVSTITDGTFVSDNADAVGSYTKQDDPQYSTATYDKVDEFIAGGTYSSDVTALCDDTYVAVKDASGNYVVIVDPLEDKAEIEGYQIKVVGSSQSTEDEGNNIDTKGLRILTKVDNDFLATCDDYGYVVAKVSGKDQATANFSLLTADSGNGQKVISCKGTSNHGLKDIDNNYVTLAVNGMGDNDQVAVRFYVVKDGVMYSYYTGAMKYNGIIATMPASN